MGKGLKAVKITRADSYFHVYDKGFGICGQPYFHLHKYSNDTDLYLLICDSDDLAIAAKYKFDSVAERDLFFIFVAPRKVRELKCM